jgi:co-chaperonin GroES (HSP10)
MKAVNHFIIIDPIKEDPKPTESGLILTEKHNDDIRYRKAKIVSAGANVKALKQDDTIYYDRHSGYGVQFEDNYYLVIKEQDVVVVL